MSEYRFLYWDDLGDSQDEVDKQKKSCANHQRELDDSEKEEEEAVRRMEIIMRNGNSGEHYFDYFNKHQSSAEIYDDEEEQDIKWAQEKKLSFYANGTEKQRLYRRNKYLPCVTQQTIVITGSKWLKYYQRNERTIYAHSNGSSEERLPILPTAIRCSRKDV